MNDFIYNQHDIPKEQYRYGPVSYTHLDVYKRQHMESFQLHWASFFRFMAANLSLTQDVYKRQGQYAIV